MQSTRPRLTVLVAACVAGCSLTDPPPQPPESPRPEGGAPGLPAGTGGSGGRPGGRGGTGGAAGIGGAGGAAGYAGASPPVPADAGQGDAPGEAGVGFSGWKYSRAITIDTTASGAGVMGPVTDYPLAVLLDAGSLDFAQARPAGADLRFGKPDGTPLPHAIESWDAAGKKAAVWVKLDRVLGNNKDQSFTMYWGNPAENDASDSKRVFDAAAGFLGVWHLAEEPNMAAGGYRDATASEAHGTAQGAAAPARVDGRIGPALSVANAMNQWVDVDEKRALFHTQDQMTISVWGRSDRFASRASIGGYDTIFSKGDSSWTIQRFSTNRTFEACVQPGDHLCSVSRTRVQNDQWYHFVAVLDHPNLRFYVNGVLEGNESDAGMWQAGDHPVGIGTQTQFLDEGRHWNGAIDEARVIAGAKDASWIKLDFETQKPGSRVLAFGPVQTR